MTSPQANRLVLSMGSLRFGMHLKIKKFKRSGSEMHYKSVEKTKGLLWRGAERKWKEPWKERMKAIRNRHKMSKGKKFS